MKGTVLDLETTALDAVGGGMIVCGVIKPLLSEPIVYRYDRLGDKPGHEYRTVKNLVEALSEFQLVIGHNIDGFDWGMLKSRALLLGVPLPKPILSYDTMKAFGRTGYRTVLNYKGKPTKSLAHIADFFGIEQMKTGIYPREHWKAVWEAGALRRKAMDNIVEHCVADVIMTEEIYWRLIETDTVDRIKRLK